MRHRVGLIVRKSAAPQLHHDRCFGHALAVAEKRIVRQHQMHPHRFDIAQRLNRALEFAFERALIIHLLGKIAARPVRLVEKLEPQAPGLRHAFRSQVQARLIQLSAGTLTLVPSLEIS